MTVVPMPRRLAIPDPRSVAEPVVYTVKEVAQLLRLSLGSTYQLIREGGIPAKKMGARWVVPKKSFHSWLDEFDQDDMKEASA